MRCARRRAVIPRRPEGVAQPRRQPRRQDVRSPSVDPEDRGVDGGTGTERGSIDHGAEVEFPPRGPGRRAQRRRRRPAVLDGDLALEDQVGTIGASVGVVEQHRQDLGRQPERWVRDDPVRHAGEAELAQVGLEDPSRRRIAPSVEISPQPLGPRRVALDGPHVDARLQEGERQRAGTGAQLDDELTGDEIERTDEPVDDGPVNEEVLAEPATPGVALGRLSPGHGPSPRRSWRHRSDRPPLG